IHRASKQNLFDDEVRLDVDIEVVAPKTTAEVAESEPPAAPIPRQVCYVGATGTELTIPIIHKPEEATPDERRAGIMQRVLTVTVSWREGVRVARKSRTLTYQVQLSPERVVRRLGNLGGILGLAPKGV